MKHRGNVYSMHMSMARSNVMYVHGVNVSFSIILELLEPVEARESDLIQTIDGTFIVKVTNADKMVDGTFIVKILDRE